MNSKFIFIAFLTLGTITLPACTLFGVETTRTETTTSNDDSARYDGLQERVQTLEERVKELENKLKNR